MYHLELLGGIVLRGPEGPVSGTATQNRQLALLALLGVAGEAGLSRDRVAAYLCPESDEASARRSITDAVYRLRKSLGRKAIVGEAATLRLNPDVVRCDVGDFEAACAEAELETAAELFRGPLLDGFHLRDSIEFEQWKDVEARRLASMYEGALEALAERAESAGDYVAAFGWWAQMAKQDPLNSRTVMRLVQAQANAGDPANALLCAQEHADLLQRELGVEPPEDLVALSEQLRSARPSSESQGGGSFQPGMPHPRRSSRPGRMRLVPAFMRLGSAKSARARRWSSSATAVTAVTIVMGGFALAMLRSGSKSELDPTRVVVVPFEDQTGDSSLLGLGSYPADWIPLELQRTLGEVLEVVPSSAVHDARQESGIDPVPAGMELARLVAAGTAISGWMRLSDDRIEVGAQLVDVNGGTLLRSVEPVSAPRDSVEALVTILAERVAIMVGKQFSPRFRWWQGRAPPPSFAAFREVEAGLEEFGRRRHPEALAHFYRAYELDSTYIEPLLHAWASHYTLGGGWWVARRDMQQMQQMQRAESLLVTIEQHQNLFWPADRGEFQWKSGTMSGDLEASYRGAEAFFATGPENGYPLALSAIFSNRPYRAIEAMSSIDPAGTWEERWPPYWNVMATAYHLTGRLREALEALERGRRAVPDPRDLLRTEIQIRAAMGQVSEVDELLDQVFARTSGQVSMVAMAADEYRAHGHEDLARAPLERALHWLQGRPPDERETPAHRFDLATILYEMGRWDDALPLFHELASETPTDPDRLGYLGITLARLGRRNDALLVAQRLRDLDTPYLYGIHTLWRARIRAALGDSAEAVDLLRQSYQEGRPYPSHSIPEFQGLGNYAPYRDFMRPRR